MTGLKETIQVNAQGAILGVQEGSLSFVNQFKALPLWKRIIILAVLIGIIPAYLIARFGTEQYLAQKYGQEALSAHAAFAVSQDPIIGKMTIIRNPNNSYSGVVLVTNPNLDLAANDISYTATFENTSKQAVYTSSGTTFLLPNEKKYLVFPRIENPSSGVASGSLKFGAINWQKRLDIPEVKLRASEPFLNEEVNPLQFVAEGSVINDSPYQIGESNIVFLLYNDQDEIIGVSQRKEYNLLPFGRRAYKQFWPGLYKDQVKKVQVIPSVNTLNPENITTENSPLPSTNSNQSQSPSSPF